MDNELNEAVRYTNLCCRQRGHVCRCVHHLQGLGVALLLQSALALLRRADDALDVRVA